jgi:hypothetical protein
MRIISKFKDYYDGGASFGVDVTHTYIRESKDINYIKYPYYCDVIGFCGKIYPFDNAISILNDDPKQFTNYDTDYKFEQYKDDSYNERYRLVKEDGKYWTFYSHLMEHKSPHSKKEYFDIIRSDKKLLEIFLQYSVPIFHIGHVPGYYEKILTLNPCLKDYAFYKIFDTIQAFQEIQMYISNVIVSDTKVVVPVGSDNVIRDSKGFDKWTFRKMKE